MRKWFLVLLVFPASNISANVLILGEIRLLYKRASTSEESCRKLIIQLQSYDEKNDPVLGGYKAVANMMMAKYVINPIGKLNYFSSGKSLLEKCINNDNYNIELRFLRFSVQTNAPSFLGYDDSIIQDKRYMLESFKKIKDSELKQLITAFLKDSAFLSSKEKQSLTS